MANTTEKLAGLVLSAYEVKELTGWNDAMTEDYLNILRNIVNVAQDVDAINDREIIFDAKAAQLLATLQGEITHNRGRFNNHERKAMDVFQLIYAW